MVSPIIKFSILRRKLGYRVGQRLQFTTESEHSLYPENKIKAFLEGNIKTFKTVLTNQTWIDTKQLKLALNLLK